MRQELLADGRYDEARGNRAGAYTGRYEVTGTRIEYWDDSGFTADGDFEGDVLRHGGYLFYRAGSRPPRGHRREAYPRGLMFVRRGASAVRRGERPLDRQPPESNRHG
ncbi:Atu4866 domain-containing protein [Actinoplanes sp. NPDC089786]|uniref:Atu4866 domain-containing protein n=1 Tax=Actinoplanes sp. NPDC089786 TaxID=3155185 RepID=UPI00341F903E